MLEYGVFKTYPAVHLWFKIAPEEASLHSDVNREAAISDEAWNAAVIERKGIALTAYEPLTNPDKVREIKEKFKELKAKEGKQKVSD